jgi:hypothetical protein
MSGSEKLVESERCDTESAVFERNGKTIALENLARV